MTMRNRILFITRNTIPYVKEIMPIAKTVTGCILMQQLDYWFERHPDGFWKFQDAAPNHPWYKEGESWAEELGFSLDEFRTAFDQIGVRYKSKSEWKVGGMSFAGKFYACYTDRKMHVTYYFRNDALLDAALDQIMAGISPASPRAASVMAEGAAKPFVAAVKVPPMLVPKVALQHQIPGNGESQSPVNGDSPFPANEGSQSPASGETQSPRNGESLPVEVGIPYPLGMGNPHVAIYKETRFTKTTQRQQQQAEHGEMPGPVDNLAEKRSSGFFAEEGTATLSAALPGSVATESREVATEQSAIVGQAAAGCLGVEGADLIFAAGLTSLEREVISADLHGCPVDLRQAVLDEVAGAIAKQTIRTGAVPFLRHLVSAVRAGTFTESLGIEIKAARIKRAQTRAAVTSGDRATRSAGGKSAHEYTEAELKILPPSIRQRMLDLGARERGSNEETSTDS